MGAREMFALVDVDTDGWGAAVDYSPERRGVRPGNDQCFVHHPGFDIGAKADRGDPAAEEAMLRRIEANAKGYWGIPYDIEVGQSGLVYAGRGLARSGATSGDVDDDGTHNNDEGEAVLVLISPGTPMTDACRASLKRLFDAHGGDVIAHRYAGGIATACPGPDRIAFVQAYNDGTLESDMRSPSEWAEDIWAWGVKVGLVNPPDHKTPTDPHDDVQKQEEVAFLHRYHHKVVGPVVADLRQRIADAGGTGDGVTLDEVFKELDRRLAE